MDEILHPPETRGRVSVACIRDHWYVACQSRALRSRPVARTILGVPMVLFRGEDGRAGALLDRCPHRNVPLSLGAVEGATLRCKYHGWTFDREGACRAIPGLCGDPSERGRRVEAYPVIERDGLVWVYPTADAAPTREPFALPLTGAAGYHTLVREVGSPGTLHATIENALDVPHTAFVHRGLFRDDAARDAIEVAVRRGADRVEAEYIGEPRPEGLFARLLSPSGGTVTHHDRFILPSIAQVEYQIGDENHVLVSALCTPVDDFRTHLTAVISLRTRLPGPLVRLLEPFGRWIFHQDARILDQQTRNIRRFGGEQYVSTEIDVLGPHIWRLLREAERGLEPDAERLVEKRLTMMV